VPKGPYADHLVIDTTTEQPVRKLKLPDNLATLTRYQRREFWASRKGVVRC
jgi:hypothetical protein